MPPRRYQSHGTGQFAPSDLGGIGDGCVLEAGVLVFHPSQVFLGHNVYVGHQTILKGYHNGAMHIGDHTWIGQQCFFHSAGGIRIGSNVGIGPGVKILTSVHEEAGRHTPILHAPLRFAPVCVQDDADIGVGAILLPGVTVGKGAQVGAGAVVSRSIPAYAVAHGVPARVQRMRDE